MEAPAILEFVENMLAFDGHSGTTLTFRGVDHPFGQPRDLVLDRRDERLVTKEPWSRFSQCEQ